MRVSRAACGVRRRYNLWNYQKCIHSSFTVYIYIVYTYRYFLLCIYVYSVVTCIYINKYIYYTFVGIYETAEPARRDNNNNNNNFCRFHGKLYSDNYNTYTPLNALKVHTYVRYSFLSVFKFFFCIILGCAVFMFLKTFSDFRRYR